MTDYLEPLLDEEDALPDETDASALAAGLSVPTPRREEDGETPKAPSPAPAPDVESVPLQGRLSAAERAALSAPRLKQGGTGSLSAPPPALLEQTLRLERTVRRAGVLLRPSAGTGGAARREEPPAPSVPLDPKLLDAAVRRDSRRYDNGFVLY